VTVGTEPGDLRRARMAQGEEALDVLHRFARMLETDRELEQRLEQRLDAALGTELWSALLTGRCELQRCVRNLRGELATEEGAELRSGPGGGQRA